MFVFELVVTSAIVDAVGILVDEVFAATEDLMWE